MSSSMPVTAAPEPAGPNAFTDKWRARWPEWAVAQVFVPPVQRPVALAWAAVQQELLDAAWGGSDARPGEAKLLWWQEELFGWAHGRRRHPLGAALQPHPAPWTGLAEALPTLRDSRERAVDGADAYSQLAPLAMAAASVEQVLFGGDPADAAVARLVASTWLQARLARAGDRVDASVAPLSTLAQAPDGDGTSGDADACWRLELLRDWPSAAAATAPRKVWAELARVRLARGRADQPLGAWTALWAAWHAARN